MDNKELLICRACGFKISKDKLKSECPACGVSRKYFDTYKDNISARRRKFLDLHIHPIIVQFSVAASVLLFLIITTGSFLSRQIDSILFDAAVVLSVCLPFFVISGAVSGIIDGILRFKKINRKILIRKIYLSIGFFTVSSATIILLVIFKFTYVYINSVLIIISLASVIFSTLLGRLGGNLSEAILPGK